MGIRVKGSQFSELFTFNPGLIAKLQFFLFQTLKCNDRFNPGLKWKTFYLFFFFWNYVKTVKTKYPKTMSNRLIVSNITNSDILSHPPSFCLLEIFS